MPYDGDTSERLQQWGLYCLVGEWPIVGMRIASCQEGDEFLMVPSPDDIVGMLMIFVDDLSQSLSLQLALLANRIWDLVLNELNELNELKCNN